jgi:uncharacterized OB-fold protein
MTTRQGEARPVPPKPMPRPESRGLTAPFWEATKRHELVCQRCRQCSKWIFYPREQCPTCFSTDLEWAGLSGQGRVFAFTIVQQPAHRAFEPDVPYAYAIVQLDEGVRMPTNIVDCALEDIRVDMPVSVTFDDVSPEWTLVKFRPA